MQVSGNCRCLFQSTCLRSDSNFSTFLVLLPKVLYYPGEGLCSPLNFQFSIHVHIREMIKVFYLCAELFDETPYLVIGLIVCFLSPALGCRELHLLEWERRSIWQWPQPSTRRSTLHSTTLLNLRRGFRPVAVFEHFLLVSFNIIYICWPVHRTNKERTGTARRGLLEDFCALPLVLLGLAYRLINLGLHARVWIQ